MVNTPHGGSLIQREASPSEKAALQQKAASLPVLEISAWTLSDLELIALGGFSPLTGFLKKADYERVVEEGRLADGTPWPVPITLPLKQAEADTVQAGKQAALRGADGIIYAILEVEEIYAYDAASEAEKVYGTSDPEHPGAARLYQGGGYYAGGSIILLERPSHAPFDEYNLAPAETRRLFEELGWKTVVGFQTRNPVHRAHEYIQKCALEAVDGLLLNPLVGETKSDDVSAAVRMESYEVILDRYYPKNRTRLVLYPAAMRYAGPREAVLHALVRKNYGCTHFIIGRDHAGVGDYYGTYEAQEYAASWEDEIGIQLFRFEHAFYCTACEAMGTAKTCPHDAADHVHLSGTKVREMLRRGEKPPKAFSRPEVADVLIAGMKEPAVKQ
ncbi:sulfate adenylyltransferase [Alkalicoccus chagannorensis]|uniref:sulfate adenylyltransferase n=1 Tax=Alkalicoccus chagannorensis TaxID=427072 RepID=UPI0004791454|nr:sulfate adenylyltransferase [Alkalicoccus chagannorensis]